MRARGFTVVETIVVVAIVSILLTVGTVRFRDYMRNYRAEAQIRMIYQEILAARINAIYQRRTTRLKFYADRFDVYSTTQDNGNGAAPIQTKSLAFSIICSKGNLTNGYSVDFEPSGFIPNSCSICLNQSIGSSAVDSVVLSGTKVHIGTKDKGNDCESANITIR